MVGAASDGSLLARPKSGIAPRLPQVTPSNPPRATAPRLRPLTRITANQSLVTARRISNRYTKLLEIELTHSQQTRKHFLIATICPTFTPAHAPHSSLATDHSSICSHDSPLHF